MRLWEESDVNYLLTDMGLRIAKLRKQMGLTQEELAELTGISGQTISAAELGKKALRPENIVKLSSALGVSTDYLLTGHRNSIDYAAIHSKLAHVSPEQYDKIMCVIDIMAEK